jgi:hypothetical protein
MLLGRMEALDPKSTRNERFIEPDVFVTTVFDKNWICVIPSFGPPDVCKNVLGGRITE